MTWLIWGMCSESTGAGVSVRICGFAVGSTKRSAIKERRVVPSPEKRAGVGGGVVAGNRDAYELVVGAEVPALRGRAARVRRSGGRVKADLEGGVEVQREGVGMEGQAEGFEGAVPVLEDGGAGVVLRGDGNNVLHQTGARGRVRAAESNLAQRLILDRLHLLLGDEEGDDVERSLSLRPKLRRLIDPLRLVGDRHSLGEAHAPSADVHDAGTYGEIPAGVDRDQVAVVRRAGRADDVDGFVPQSLAGDDRLFVDIGLKRDAALLCDHRAVFPCLVITDACAIASHG